MRFFPCFIPFNPTVLLNCLLPSQEGPSSLPLLCTSPDTTLVPFSYRNTESMKLYGSSLTHTHFLLLVPFFRLCFVHKSEKWDISCHLSKQGFHSHQWLSCVSWWALRKLRKEKNTCHLAAIRLQLHPKVSPEETQDVETQDTAPVSWGACQNKDFSEPRPLHLPVYRKVLNSLTWNIWFSLTNNNLMMFWLPVLCCKAPVYTRSLLSLLEQFLRAI